MCVKNSKDPDQLTSDEARSMKPADLDLHSFFIPGHVAQSVTCLATDAWLTTDSGVMSWIPARSHTFVETDLT